MASHKIPQTISNLALTEKTSKNVLPSHHIPVTDLFLDKPFYQHCLSYPFLCTQTGKVVFQFWSDENLDLFAYRSFASRSSSLSLCFTQRFTLLRQMRKSLHFLSATSRLLNTQTGIVSQRILQFFEISDLRIVTKICVGANQRRLLLLHVIFTEKWLKNRKCLNLCAGPGRAEGSPQNYC